MEADFKSKWLGSSYVCGMVFGVCDAAQCQIAFNFSLSDFELNRIETWVWKQRSKKLSWELITRLLQVEYQERGNVVHRIPRDYNPKAA